MAQENGFSRNVWWVVMIISCLFLVWTLFTMSNGGLILENGLKQFAGSTFDLAELDEAGRGFLDLSMIKPLWEELWFVVFGIFFALKLKQMKKYAWTLGIIWSAIMLGYGVIQGGYEMVILGWSSPCVQTYIFLGLGLIPLVCLLVAKKRFLQYEE